MGLSTREMASTRLGKLDEVPPSGLDAVKTGCSETGVWRGMPPPHVSDGLVSFGRLGSKSVVAPTSYHAC